LENEVLFFQRFDEVYIPSLRLVHKCTNHFITATDCVDPDAFTPVQVDRGAIKFVLSGANIMYFLQNIRLTLRCPGLTSKGARMDEDIPVDTVVAVMAEGKENALAVGQMKMSSGDIRTINKGIGVETLTCLGDPLWQLKL
jgi:malignant T-cell-amplified sequence